MEYLAGTYDVAVIGAGHAGIEAGLAAARLGCRTWYSPSIWTRWAICPAIRHRRHRQGSVGPGAGRPRRRDGQGRRPLLHPIPDAQPGQGSGRPLAPRPGRPPEVPGGHEAHPGAAAQPGPEAGHGHRSAAGGRPCGRRRYPSGGGIRRQGRGHRLGHLSQCPGHHRDCAYESGPDGMHAGLFLTERLAALASPSAGSRPERRPGSTPAAWISPKWSSRRATGTLSPSPSPPGRRRKTGPCAT